MRLVTRLLIAALVGVVLLALLLVGSSAITWSQVAGPAAIAASAAIAIAWLGGRRLQSALGELTSVTRALASGDLSRRPPLRAPGEAGDLATALNRLGEQFGLRIAALQTEEALLVALIESLSDGVIAFGARSEVVRINSVARDLLGIEHPVPFPSDRLPRASELHRAVQTALAGRGSEPFELTFGGRTISVSARPLPGGGAVVALFDLTRLRELETIRRDFVANVSHELRTPLTVISGFAETLSEHDPPREERARFASMIRMHAARMQHIVDDLLDISRLESGGWVADVVEVDVLEAAREAIAGVQKAAEEKDLTLVIDIGSGAESMSADATALRQVLSNLVQNAVRHTTHGKVEIFARREESGVRVGVRDTGPGIDARHLPRIFERFYRADAGRARHSGGTGLGLAIVKHLVERHGGSVEADSRLGAGTTIAALFPHRSPAAADGTASHI